MRSKHASVIAVALATAACHAVTEPEVPEGFLDDPTAQWADIGESCSATSPATTVAEAGFEVPSPSEFGSPPNDNRTWADAARELPGGIGGLFLRRDTLWLWMVDPNRFDRRDRTGWNSA